MKLYKYRSNKLEEHFLREIFEKNRFHFADWKTLNDPMEGYFRYYIKKFPESKLKDFVNEKQKYRVCCLSSRYDDILMWSHYAKGHRGLCIEIEASNDDNRISKVKYCKNIPWLLPDRKESTPSPKDILTCKIYMWSNEEEYRAIIGVESALAKGVNDKAKLGEITGVIFGVRAEPSFKELIEGMLQKNVTIYDAKINFDNNCVQRVKKPREKIA